MLSGLSAGHRTRDSLLGAAVVRNGSPPPQGVAIASSVTLLYPGVGRHFPPLRSRTTGRRRGRRRSRAGEGGGYMGEGEEE
eukprot:2132602-Pyramimonas_sp.AAC.1